MLELRINWHVVKHCVLVSGEAVRYGARGASVGRGGAFRGSPCFVFPLRAGLRSFFLH